MRCGRMSAILMLEVFIKVANVLRGKQCSFMSFSALLRAHSQAVVHWRSQTNDRIFEEGDRMYLNALENQVIPYSEMRSLNYLPNNYNVPLNVKFILEPNSSRTSSSSQAQTQTPIILWCQVVICRQRQSGRTQRGKTSSK